eukprot:1805159-Rhodomonas_salina.2
MLPADSREQKPSVVENVRVDRWHCISGPVARSKRREVYVPRLVGSLGLPHVHPLACKTRPARVLDTVDHDHTAGPMHLHHSPSLAGALGKPPRRDRSCTCAGRAMSMHFV